MTNIKIRALEHVATVHADWTRFVAELPDVGNATKQVSEHAKRYFKDSSEEKRRITFLPDIGI